MKRTFAILLFCLAAFGLPAQSLTEHYAERFGRIGRAYAADPDGVEPLYEMACFYFDNSHPMRNLPEAMNYIRRAEEAHIRLLEDNKIKELTRLLRKGIDLTTLRQQKQAIAEAARRTVEQRTDFTAAELDAYAAAFDGDAVLMRRLRQHRLRLAYADAQADPTPEACYRFLTLYPGTSEAAHMEDLLQQLAETLFANLESEAAVDSVAARYPQSPAVTRRAEQRKSSLAYAEVLRAGSMEACRDYLSRYPTSSESQAVRERFDALVEADLRRRQTAMELAHFADSNADLPLADEALASLRDIAYRTHDVAALQYYVDHFKLDPYYNEVYGQLYSWYAVEGNGAPLQHFAEANPRFPYPRALEDDLERAEDIDSVPLEAPYREADYSRYADCVRRFMGKAIAVVPLQRMLQPLLPTRRHAEAVELLQRFEICFDNQWQRQYDELIRLLSAPAQPARRLQTEVSDSVLLLHPVVNPADGALYYTRVADGRHTVVRSVRRGNAWQAARPVPFDNTTADDLTLFGFSADGSQMLLGSGGDIWMAARDGDAWRISDLPPYPVNTDYIETDAFLLPDGSGMLLASDRPGGHNLQRSGERFHGDTALATDLWFIPCSQGHWGTPVNLGIGLNTPYCERSPILSRNLRTLYFVSDGYTGLGYGDVMVAERTSLDDWTSWSTPQNMGCEVNSPWDERSVSFAPGERRLYLASDASATEVSSCAAWHDTAVTYRTYSLGVVGLEPYLFRVFVADLDRQTVVGTVDYQGEGTTLPLTLRRNGRYALLADAGSLFVPALPVTKAPRGMLHGYTFDDLVASDRPLPLSAVLFDDDSDDLLPVGLFQMEQLARFLLQHPQGRVELCIDVAGGDTRRCYRLALRRCEALWSFLTAKGVSPERVILSPYGNASVGRTGKAAVAIRLHE